MHASIKCSTVCLLTIIGSLVETMMIKGSFWSIFFLCSHLVTCCKLPEESLNYCQKIEELYENESEEVVIQSITRSGMSDTLANCCKCGSNFISNFCKIVFENYRNSKKSVLKVAAMDAKNKRAFVVRFFFLFKQIFFVDCKIVFIENKENVE